jgi:hypothetical protein
MYIPGSSLIAEAEAGHCRQPQLQTFAADENGRRRKASEILIFVISLQSVMQTNKCLHPWQQDGKEK